MSSAGVHLAHRRRGADRGGVGAHALRQRRGVEPAAPRRAGVRLRRLLAAPVGAAHAPLLVLRRPGLAVAYTLHTPP